MPRLALRLALLALLALLTRPAHAQSGRPLTLEDMMKFRTITGPALSEDGRWLVYATTPDRGDPTVEVLHLDSDRSCSITRGGRATISSDGEWVAVMTVPPLAEREKKPEPRPGDPAPPPSDEQLVLIPTETLEPLELGPARQHAFTRNSKWILLHRPPEKPETPDASDPSAKPAAEAPAPPSLPPPSLPPTRTPPSPNPPSPNPPEPEPKTKQESRPTRAEREEKRRQQAAGPLVLRRLETGEEHRLSDRAVEFVVDGTGRYLAFIALEAESNRESFHLYDLEDLTPIFVRRGGRLRSLTSAPEATAFAFLASSGSRRATASSARLFVWSPGAGAPQEIANSTTRDGWVLPLENQLTWTRTGRRLFFGMRPAGELPPDEPEQTTEPDPRDVAALLDRSGVDVWHWNDPRIVTHRKKQWREIERRTYRAVYHADRAQVVVLGGPDLPEVDVAGLDLAETAPRTLGFNGDPYLKEVTWDGRYHDASVVDLETGERQRFATRLSRRGSSISPGGRFAVYYQNGHWSLYDIESDSHRVLTAELEVSFANEDHDYPSDAPGYGIAGWLESDRGVLIYDKFDIWLFSTREPTASCWTGGEGRRGSRQFRALRVDPEARSFSAGQPVLLSAYHDREKTQAFYRATVGTNGVECLLEDACRFTFVGKAKKCDRIIFTRESYDVFPDLWTSNLDLEAPRRSTDVNPQTEEFAWGNPRLVEWRSLDGTPLQGVLIEPETIPAGPRPMMVYFYRFYSPRRHQFAHPRIGHRPALAYYVSHGYSVFLPDVRFEIGRPGLSATKCILPGVQKLIAEGVADPEAIGLHGHSWSGYQTAFMITQTDLFAAAIAGAPVSNMTSAYGGIRWQSGLSRQFQYEKSQSRLGTTPWDAPDVYLENSPLFFADRIRTPLLMMFGDQDGAVPWYQGLELYMALRRLERNCVLLTYRGEGHGLRKYPNRLDYCVRMKEYFDHYLRGAPAPEWIREGRPYRGD